MTSPFNPSPRGSLNWGADRIRRLLDREEQERGAQLLSAGPEFSSSGRNRGQRSPASQSDGMALGARQFHKPVVPNDPMPASRVWEPQVLAQAEKHVRANTPEATDQGTEVRAEAPEYFEDYVAARAAISEMVGSQLPGRESGPADAYRHILWAGELTRRFGEDYARQLLGLHEFEGNVWGQSDENNAMDTSNNEIGIQVGIGARTYDDVVSAARKVIGGSAANGLGDWEPDYDPTSTMAPHAAQWLPEPQWKNNPSFEVPRRYPFPPVRPQEMPTHLTNWYSNVLQPAGPDWSDGYVPDGYAYAYGSPQHATRNWPLWWWLTGPR